MPKFPIVIRLAIASVFVLASAQAQAISPCRCWTPPPIVFVLFPSLPPAIAP